MRSLTRHQVTQGGMERYMGRQETAQGLLHSRSRGLACHPRPRLIVTAGCAHQSRVLMGGLPVAQCIAAGHMAAAKREYTRPEVVHKPGWRMKCSLLMALLSYLNVQVRIRSILREG